MLQKPIILLSMCLIFSFSVFARNKWAIYQNARFGYSIAYPADLFEPQGEADNGDGQVFSNDSAEMRVYGSQLLLHQTLRGEFDALVKEHGNVSYKFFRPGYFVVSGTENDKIFYQKTTARTNGTFVTFYIEYPTDKRAGYDDITTKIVKSFR